MSSLFTFAPLLTIVIVAIWTSAWAFHDARKRGKNPVVVALLVLFAAWPFGLILWLIFRPDVKGPPPFNLDDYRVQ